jgi:hypothetical protein
MTQCEPLLSRLSTTTFTERSRAQAPLSPPPYVIGGGGGGGAGGQHRSPQGDSTRDDPALALFWFEQERQAFAGLADVAW